MKINAAVVFETSGDFRIEELELSEPNDDEVLVRVVASGICHTDLAGRAGHLPIPPPPSVFGHEGSGIVEKVGARVTKVKPGDHVVLAWDYCGTCSPCKQGKVLYCLNFLNTTSMVPGRMVPSPCLRVIDPSMVHFSASLLLLLMPWRMNAMSSECRMIFHWKSSPQWVVV